MVAQTPGRLGCACVCAKPPWGFPCPAPFRGSLDCVCAIHPGVSLVLPLPGQSRHLCAKPRQYAPEGGNTEETPQWIGADAVVAKTLWGLRNHQLITTPEAGCTEPRYDTSVLCNPLPGLLFRLVVYPQGGLAATASAPSTLGFPLFCPCWGSICPVPFHPGDEMKRNVSLRFTPFQSFHSVPIVSLRSNRSVPEVK